MAYPATGRPEIDAVLNSPIVQDYILRRIRYGQTRVAEAMLASLMVAVGVALLARGSTMSLPSFRIIAEYASEDTAGWISLAAGSTRLVALWLNGRQNMPAIRALGCAGGFVFWSAWSFGLWRTSPPLVPLAPCAAVFAAFELFSLGKCVSDVYVFNSLGLRRLLSRPRR